MKITGSITGRLNGSAPERQGRLPAQGKDKKQPRPISVDLQGIDFAQIEYRLAKLWEMFPRLHLPEKYGEDLLERDGISLVLPSAEDIAQWKLRKLQQYYVALQGEDPAEFDETSLRIRVAQAVKARLADRQLLQNFIDGKVAITKKNLSRRQSTKVKVSVDKTT